jgi:tetratricopeptide (TPR) repeat protein
VSLAVFGTVCMAGCSTTSEFSPRPAKLPSEQNRVFDQRAAALEVAEASKLVDAGDTSAVIPKLLSVIVKYPSSEAALDARYWLGMAYYKIGDYRSAIDLFNEYLRLNPSGKYAVACSEQAAHLTSEYNTKFLTPEKLDEGILKATEQLGKTPDDVKAQLDLGNLLWQRGDFDKAGGIYKQIVTKHPEYVNNDAVKSRVEFLPNGDYKLLTPAEVQRRQVEADPLAIINTSSFHSGQDLFTREARFYAVTGQVVNRSSTVLNGVQVIITIYGFGNVVYDTTTVNIGRLNPREIRAFSVRFSNFENIENINRYECVGTFQR